MGSPIAPTLANIFLCHQENIWLKNCPTNFTPLFYKIYIDDTFVLFKTHGQTKLFLKYLNKQHPNIKFTIEIESNKTLLFLDILISLVDNNLTSNTYRKPTFTSLGINFPLLYKINIVKALIFRAYNLNSNSILFHREIEFLLNYFKSNNFPSNLVFTHLKFRRSDISDDFKNRNSHV